METENHLIIAIDAERPAHPETHYDIGYNNGLTMAVAIAVRMDGVDVVRCKNCTEWGGVPFGNVCRRWSAPLAGMKNCTGPDDYCSYGKRRTDNEVHSSDPCHL